VERERWEWRVGDGGDGDLAAGLTDFLERHGLPTDLSAPGTDPPAWSGRRGRAPCRRRRERAEHIMILDLARNDRGRLAAAGSVRVERLFELREWRGLWQAESTVAARLRPGTGVAHLLAAVLPGGSVTGAPKRAAAVLAAIEAAERVRPAGAAPRRG